MCVISMVFFQNSPNNQTISSLADFLLLKWLMLFFHSAGVGRTGTLIAIDTALSQASKEKQVDIPKIIVNMRRQRMKMVQTVVRKKLDQKPIQWVWGGGKGGRGYLYETVLVQGPVDLIKQ